MKKLIITQNELNDCFMQILDSMEGVAEGIKSDNDRVYEIGLDHVNFTEQEIIDLSKKYDRFFKAFTDLPDFENLVLSKKLEKIGESY